MGNSEYEKYQKKDDILKKQIKQYQEDLDQFNNDVDSHNKKVLITHIDAMLSFIPEFEESKSLIESIYGNNYITNEEYSEKERIDKSMDTARGLEKTEIDDFSKIKNIVEVIYYNYLSKKDLKEREKNLDIIGKNLSEDYKILLQEKKKLDKK